MSEFKKGDVVEMKTGGPAMTITDIEEGKCWVTWFQDGKIQTDVCGAVALKKREAPKGGGVRIQRT